MATASLLVALTALALSTPPEGERAYQRARAAFEQQDYAGALTHLKAATTADPRPLYVYNTGRVLEALGRYAEARETYLRCAAMPATDSNVVTLSGEKAASLAEKAAAVVLVVKGLQPSELLLIDERVVGEDDGELLLKPGEHQVCRVLRGGGRVVCARRTFGVGRRISVPAAVSAQTGALRWAGGKARSLTLNGRTLPLDLKRLHEIVVPAGQHVVRVTGADGAVRTVRASVAPGGVVQVGAPVAVEKETPHVAGEVVSSGPGPWPWVVTGFGVAALAGGAGLMIVADGARDIPRDGDGFVVGTRAELQQQWDDGRTPWNTGVVLVSVGAAATISGVVWALMSQDSDPKAASGAWVAPGLGGVTIGGSF